MADGAREPADFTLPSDALAVVLQFGVSMLCSGSTAFRARQCIETLARKLGFDMVSISLTLDSIAISAHRGREWSTLVAEVGPSGINASRIGELEQLAEEADAEIGSREIATRLADIASAPRHYSDVQIAAAVGMASGGFAFLNGGAMPEVVTAAIAGGFGQGLRLWLARRQHNQYAIVALCAVAASGIYVLAAICASHIGIGFEHYPAGFISSVLFLIPGFPLIAGLFDLLHHQTVAAVSRLAHGLMVLAAVAFGLSIVIAVAGIDITRQTPLELAYPPTLVLRAVASFVGGCAFAMLFNNSPRTVWVVGLVALGANELRLGLHDLNTMLAPAAFFGALAVGMAALLAQRYLVVSPIALTAPAIVIMVPGLYAYEAIVLFNRGQALDALQAAALCSFIVGALAMGLAAARFLTRR